jgi:CheY-like chemotaxis protein
LVELMGGQIGVESEPDQGSTFWFTAEFPVQDVTPTVIPHRVSLEGLRALVVDDNATNRDILMRQLTAWEVNCTALASGAEAIKAADNAVATGMPFALVLLDMQMPDMSGLQLAKLLHANPVFADLKIVVLTSMGLTLPREELEAAGIGRCLVKPVRQLQLREALSGLLQDLASKSKSAQPFRLAPAAPEASQLGPADLPLRILVAEDNLVNQHVARRHLEKLGYWPVIVANGSQAEEAVRAQPFDVILMDCQMPEVDGFEATRRIRAWEADLRATGTRRAALHIIAMTANAMQGDREACLAAGMDDYLSKPMRSGDLAAALARAPATSRGI